MLTVEPVLVNQCSADCQREIAMWATMPTGARVRVQPLPTVVVHAAMARGSALINSNSVIFENSDGLLIVES